MDETTFFEYEGVKVTNTRFVVDGQTFAMNNITSVKPLEKKPNRLMPILLLILGAALAIQVSVNWLALCLIGAIWLFRQKTVYHVMLHTSGGESSALKTFQREYLDKVVSGLNQAIVHRG